jgi:uncharacterized protein YukE
MLDKQIHNNSFVTKSVSVVGVPGESILVRGTENTEFLQQAIKEIAECKALCAYLREAIKAKDALIQEVRDYVSPEAIALSNNKPHSEAKISKEDVINGWPIEKRLRYYTLEAHAATFGVYVHPDGDIAKQRDIFHEALANKSVLKEHINQILIYTDTPTVSEDAVERVFFDIQKKHREYQAELNSLKTEIDNAVSLHNTKVASDYQIAFDQWSHAVQDHNNKDSILRSEWHRKVSQYKIIIPDNLTAIVKRIENL